LPIYELQILAFPPCLAALMPGLSPSSVANPASVFSASQGGSSRRGGLCFDSIFTLSVIHVKQKKYRIGNYFYIFTLTGLPILYIIISGKKLRRINEITQ
jgi:hypothetical protein